MRPPRCLAGASAVPEGARPRRREERGPAGGAPRRRNRTCYAELAASPRRCKGRQAPLPPLSPVWHPQGSAPGDLDRLAPRAEADADLALEPLDVVEADIFHGWVLPAERPGRRAGPVLPTRPCGRTEGPHRLARGRGLG